MGWEQFWGLGAQGWAISLSCGCREACAAPMWSTGGLQLSLLGLKGLGGDGPCLTPSFHPRIPLLTPQSFGITKLLEPILNYLFLSLSLTTPFASMLNTP